MQSSIIYLLLLLLLLLSLIAGSLQRIVQDAGAGVVLEKAKLDEVRLVYYIWLS